MIESFANKQTEKIYNGEYVGKIPHDIQRRVLNKLRVLNAITDIQELLNPPSNRLEALKGKRKGQYSIRINQQWRICFNWGNANAYSVEITDYH